MKLSLLALACCLAVGGVWSKIPEAPPQLNLTSYAYCLSLDADTGSVRALPDLPAIKSKHNLEIGDDLLVYLMLYGGQRIPGWVNKTIQEPAWQRFAKGYWPQGTELASRVRTKTVVQQEMITPGWLFSEAIDVCGSDNDVFCAALVCHDVLRTLGRWKTNFGDKTHVDYNPDWFTANQTQWIQDIPVIQSQMISLWRDCDNYKPGSPSCGDRWGAWYHSFGLFAYGVNDAAVEGEKLGLDWTHFVAEMNRILNYFLQGNNEKPVKAEIDLEAVAIIFNVLTGKLSPVSALDCTSRLGYVLPIPKEA